MYTYKLYNEIYNIKLMRSIYSDNNNTAIIAETEEGEPFGVLTVNLGEDLPKDMAYINTNNMPDALDFLIKNDLAEDTGKTGKSGFCTYPLVKLKLDKIPELKF